MGWLDWLIRPAQTYTPDCKARAMFACFIYGTACEVRVVVGMIKGSGNWHCQAQAKLRETWQYLSVDDKFRIREGVSDTFLPAYYWKPERLMQFIKQSEEVDA